MCVLQYMKCKCKCNLYFKLVYQLQEVWILVFLLHIQYEVGIIAKL